jgi:hypothetical protein
MSRPVEKAWCYWVCILIVLAMFTEAVIRIVATGLMIASGWWLLKKLTHWVLGIGRSHEKWTVASEKAQEITPISCVFTKVR